MNLILIYCFNFGFFLLFLSAAATPCALRKYEAGYVCVCDNTYCDTLDDITINPNNGKYVMVSSSKDKLRFKVTYGKIQSKFGLPRNQYNAKNHFCQFKQKTFQEIVSRIGFYRTVEQIAEQPTKLKNVRIIVKRRKKLQKIIGFGGALTGSVSHLLQKLDSGLQRKIYKSYFSQTDGIAYSIIRMPIGGCDFDLEPWAYNEFPINDVKLSNFTELNYKDLIKVKQIHDLIHTTNNPNIKFIGATWSSPPWMKSNNRWSGYSFLQPEFYQTWADYHIRFLELMSEKHINFWGISTGNEPLNGNYFADTIPFMSLGWSPRNQSKWLDQHLGPTIRQHFHLKNIKIIAGDDQRFIFPWWFQLMNRQNSSVRHYVNGFGVHWYYDKMISPVLLDQTHINYPKHFILNTESSIGDQPNDIDGPTLGSWERAEAYIIRYMEDLKHWVNGWIDWNLILDEMGGPNNVQIHVDAPIIINSTSFTEFYKQPIFYAIGHFSRFIPEHSVRIDVRSSDKQISAIGFQRPDLSIAIIFYNNHTEPVELDFRDRASGEIHFQIPAKSIHSIVYY